MAIALVATRVTLPAEDGVRREPTPLSAPIKALRHRGLLTVGLTSLFYNVGFFTLLAFTTFPLDLSAHGTGLVFFGWGLMLAITSVVVAPWVQRRVGTFAGMTGALAGFAVILAVMAVWTDSKAVLIVAVVLAGGFLGVNNTLITETVMKIAPVERGVASASYSFVRFSGGAVAPWLAGHLGERSLHLPYWFGAAAVLVALGILASGRARIRPVDAQPGHGAEPIDSETEAEAVTLGT